MEQQFSFGAWLRRRRKALDLTQDELAGRVGCATATIKKIEADERRPSRQMAERLAGCLDVPPAEQAAFLAAARSALAVDALEAPQGTVRPPLPAPHVFPPITSAGAGQSAPSSLADVLAAQGYLIRELLGSGGFGVVYRAEQPALGRDVAVKVLRPERASDPAFLRRFAAEAAIIAKLEHPHIVPLYAFWHDSTRAYLVLRFIRGGSLQHSLRHGSWPLRRTTRLLEQLAAALTYTHRKGVVHRDIKPANVLLDAEGNAYLTDFGIAQDQEATTPTDATREATIVGSPEYLTPEQITGAPVTTQTDIYSLGVLLYELLAGAAPFAALPAAERLARQLRDPLPPLSRPGLSDPIDEVLGRATAKRPADRYPDVLAMLEAWRRAAAVDAHDAPLRLQSDERPAPMPVGRAASNGATLGADDTQVGNIPIPPTRLVGREQELIALEALLARPEVRLVTLTGPGGTGKTRLAIELATRLQSHFPDGVWFVDLAPARTLGQVEAAIAQRLSVREDGPESLGARITRVIRTRQLLLVLDNYEQIVQTAPLLAELLAAAPGVKLLVTSRAALRLRAEHEIAVPPLPIPVAERTPDMEAISRYATVQLFVERARVVRPQFGLTARNASVIVTICTRLDGLPLAIELAAARVRVFTPETLLERLDDRLQLLTGGPHDLPDRQQTIRATIDWSYELLDAEGQRLLARLGVFASGWSLAMAEAVAADELLPVGTVAAALERLIEHSRVQVREAGDTLRFSMLETVRAYALEQLVARGELEPIRARQVAELLSVSAHTDEAELDWLPQMAIEHANIEDVLTWVVAQGQAAQGLLLCRNLGFFFWETRGYLRSGRHWLEQLLQLEVQVAPLVRADALNQLGICCWLLGSHAAAEVAGLEAYALALAAGDVSRAGWFLEGVGIARYHRGDLANAQATFEQALEVQRQAGYAATGTLLHLGLVAFAMGDHDRAEAWYARTLAQAEDEADAFMRGRVRTALAEVVLARGEHQRALGLLLVGLRYSGESRAVRPALYALMGLAAVCGSGAVLQGPEAPLFAARLWGAIERQREEHGLALSPVEWPGYERARSAARAPTEPAAWDTAWAEGRALVLDEAVAMALQLRALQATEGPGNRVAEG